jgi:hypothetical protein
MLTPSIGSWTVPIEQPRGLDRARHLLSSIGTGSSFQSIFPHIWSMAYWMLKDADFCRCGNSLKVTRKLFHNCLCGNHDPKLIPIPTRVHLRIRRNSMHLLHRLRHDPEDATVYIVCKFDRLPDRDADWDRAHVYFGSAAPSAVPR